MSSSRARVLLIATCVAVLVIALLVVRQIGELRAIPTEVGGAEPTAPADPAPPPPSSPPSPLPGDASAGEPSGETSEPSPRRPPPGVPADAQRATIDRVVDGDTVRVRVAPEDPGPIAPTGSVPVRLLSIDTPETVHPRRDVECGGPEASARARQLLPEGSEVWLAIDVSDTDRFDRYLRAVWTADGTFVNAVLVAEGLAEAVRFPPDERWYAQLAAAEDEARAAGRGNWSRCAA